jgi:hypothetical protein
VIEIGRQAYAERAEVPRPFRLLDLVPDALDRPEEALTALPRERDLQSPPIDGTHPLDQLEAHEPREELAGSGLVHVQLGSYERERDPPAATRGEDEEECLLLDGETRCLATALDRRIQDP